MKRLWPAVLAVIVLLVVYFAMRRRGDDTAAAPPPSPPPHATLDPADPPPRVPPAPAGSAAAPGEADLDDQRGSGPIVGTPQVAESPPDNTPKKGKMNLDEKLAETAKHIDVMKHRADLLRAEIDQLDKAGKTKEAQEQRVVLERLEKHMKSLQTAIDEHKEPM